MEDFFTISNLFTLCMLILLQAVLGFDNLLYISLESKRVKKEKQASVRKLGIGLAIVLRIVLLFIVMRLINFVGEPLFDIHISNYINGTFTLHSIIVLVGGVFIIYTAVKEISHMLVINELGMNLGNSGQSSILKAVTLIVIMNAIFSFDSILSALALTQVFATMAIAIIFSGLLMIFLADGVSTFLAKNRMYEVLGLFILFVVGIMLLSEGGHLAHLKFFGYEVTPMSKSTFYFVIGVLVVIDFVQSRYQKKLEMIRRFKKKK